MIRRPLNERAMITAEYFDRCVGLLVDNMGVVVPVSVNRSGFLDELFCGEFGWHGNSALGQ
jgi:hypothetical protein